MLREKKYLSDSEKDALLPDVVIEVSANEVYLLFADYGITSQSVAGWSICKMLTSSGTTTRTWANGNRNFDLVASNYLTFVYTFLK